MNTYEINNIQYSLYFEDLKLIIKGVHYQSLTDYKCVIETVNSRIIDSLELLYEILCDGFSNSNENIDLMIDHILSKNEIHLILNIDFKYIDDSLEFTMKTEKDLVDLVRVENKLTYFNKKLNGIDDNYSPMFELIQTLTERIEQLEYETRFSRKLVRIQNTDVVLSWVCQINVKNNSQIDIMQRNGPTVSNFQFTNGNKDYTNNWDMFNDFLQSRNIEHNK